MTTPFRSGPWRLEPPRRLMLPCLCTAGGPAAPHRPAEEGEVSMQQVPVSRCMWSQCPTCE
jgi:hypothetical protein